MMKIFSLRNLGFRLFLVTFVCLSLSLLPSYFYFQRQLEKIEVYRSEINGEKALLALSDLSHFAYLTVSGEKVKQGEVLRVRNNLLNLSRKVSSNGRYYVGTVMVNSLFSKGALDAFVKNPYTGDSVSEMGSYIAEKSGLYTDSELKSHMFMEVSSRSFPRLYSDLYKLRDAIERSNSGKSKQIDLMGLSISLEERVKRISNKLRRSCSIGDTSKSVAMLSRLTKLNSAFADYSVFMSKFWQTRQYDSKRALLALNNLEKTADDLWKFTTQSLGESLESREKAVVKDFKFFLLVFVIAFVSVFFVVILIMRSIFKSARHSKKLSNLAVNFNLSNFKTSFENSTSRVEPFITIDSNIAALVDILIERTDSAKKVLEFAAKIADDASTLAFVQKPYLNGVLAGLSKADEKIRLRNDSDASLSVSAQNMRDKLNSLEQNLRLQANSASDVKEDISFASNVAKKLLHSLVSLKETSEKMSVVAETFTALADQANILGLNLAIETAKAGIKGSGLGTLSEQIRILSKRTVVSVLDIASIKDLILEQVENSSGDVQNFLSSLESDSKIIEDLENNASDLTVSLSKMSSAVNSISSALRERESLDISLEGVKENIEFVDESITNFAEFAKSTNQDLANLRANLDKRSDRE